MMRRPVLVTFPYVTRDGVRFTTPHADVLVQGPLAILQEVLRRCDGTRTLTQILDEVDPDDRDALREVLIDLERAGVLSEPDRTFRSLHRDGDLPSSWASPGNPEQTAPLWRPVVANSSWNPGAPSQEAAGLLKLMAQRRSAEVSTFGGDLTAGQLASLARAAYGAPAAGRRTVPSAGALTPLVVHVLCVAAVQPLRERLWWYDPEGDSFHALSDPGDRVHRLATEESLAWILARCRAVLFLSGDLERTASVYGNRGYRYVCFEVGAAMQNAMLAATTAGIAIRPVGAFDDSEVARMLELPDHVVPLLGLAIG